MARRLTIFNKTCYDIERYRDIIIGMNTILSVGEWPDWIMKLRKYLILEIVVTVFRILAIYEKSKTILLLLAGSASIMVGLGLVSL